MPSDETKKNPLNLRRKFISAESFSLGKKQDWNYLKWY